MKYRQTYKIRGHEITPDYLLKPIYIMHYFHDCYANYCTDLGLAAFDLQKENKTWIMTEIKIDFLTQLPRWRETIEMDTWTKKISGLRIEQNFTAFYNNEIIAKGTGRWVVINETTRRPVLQENLSKFMKCFQEDVYTNFKFNKIPQLKEYNYRESYIIRPDEVDFNMHLNSIRYISRAPEAIPKSYTDQHTLRSFQAKYIKETGIGDMLESPVNQNKGFMHHQLNKVVDNKNIEIFSMLSEWS